MNTSDRLAIKQKKSGDYYKQLKKEYGKQEADRIIYKVVMGFYPEEAWLYNIKE